MRTLALVRPVGMSDDMASDWLAVALVELRPLTDEQFTAGCGKARAGCTHHGQLVPTILAGASEVGVRDMASSFTRQWNAGLADYLGRTAQLEDKSEAQKLIEQTTESLRP